MAVSKVLANFGLGSKKVLDSKKVVGSKKVISSRKSTVEVVAGIDDEREEVEDSTKHPMSR